MDSVNFDCDCDRVIEMEEMRLGTEEILQYARAVLSRNDIRTLVRGLGEILSARPGELDGAEMEAVG